MIEEKDLFASVSEDELLEVSKTEPLVAHMMKCVARNEVSDTDALRSMVVGLSRALVNKSRRFLMESPAPMIVDAEQLKDMVIDLPPGMIRYERPGDRPLFLDDAKRFRWLLQQIEEEAENGEWAVKLRYDNCGDSAVILDGANKRIAQCGDLDKDPDAQFRAAIDKALVQELKDMKEMNMSKPQ